MTSLNIIVGSNGFIGQNLKNKLILENQNYFEIKTLNESNLSLIAKKINKTIKEIQIENLNLFHLGGTTEWIKIHSHPDDFEKDSIKLAKNVIDFKSRLEKPLITIFPSSGKVYNESSEPIAENHTINPKTTLGRTKVLLENLFQEYKLQNEKLYIGRIFNVYGFGQKESFLIPSIIKQLSSSRVKYLELGNLTDVRDYLHVSDVATALQIISKKPIINSNVEIINIGSGNGFTAINIAKIILKIFNLQIDIKSVSMKQRRDESSIEIVNNNRLKQFGWKQDIALEKGLELCIKESIKL
jgi:nucleoside-diphosphate-sugar epimerase